MTVLELTKTSNDTLRTISPVPTMLKNESGYVENIFEGKADQMIKVANYIKEKGFIPESLIENEVAWLYSNLGIDDQYFALESVEVIAKHVMALYGAKINAYIRDEDKEGYASSSPSGIPSEHHHNNQHQHQHPSMVDINLKRESDDNDRAVYIHTSKPGVSTVVGPQYEKRIDTRYLNISSRRCSYRLESYRSLGTVSYSSTTQLRCYFVSRCQWVDPDVSETETDIKKVSDITFLSRATEKTLDLYQKVMLNVLTRTGPVIEMFEIEGIRQKRLVIGYRQQTTLNLFSALSDLYHYYGLFSSRKYVEQFANGVTIITLYLNPLMDSGSNHHLDGSHPPPPPIELSILQIMKETSLIYCLPTTPLQSLFQEAKLSVQEAIYGYVGFVFAGHFLNRLGSEFVSLASIVDQNNPVHLDVLARLKKRLRQDTFTREYVLDIIKRYPVLIRALYVNFAMAHYIGSCSENSLQPSLSFQRLHMNHVLNEDEIIELIRRTVVNNHEYMVFESLLTFNRHVLKTNFYLQTKVALSFRLDPAFVPQGEYPIRPFGLFLVIGSEFKGFHLRFRDIARGGIRIIRSRNSEAYSINFRSLFDENYWLAATQQRKNKDIPEGGSKGTILLNVDQQEKSVVAFQKYVDSLLDLVINPGKCGPTNERIVDHLGAEEILFLGPDEGSAEYMDWASQHAQKRGASFWKAFTTGKSQSLGGIPHDLYGMTTRSVHQYVLGIYRKLGLREESIQKIQTGGPDGDLGSNEIKISNDRTLAVVDGSGVIFDPDGLNRSELLRLANGRQMVTCFDDKKLGPRGARILIEDKDVRLPDGHIVEDGLRFRNEFHLSEYAACDLFVPCGGRPESVDASNVTSILTGAGEDGRSPKWKYVVEGANLFFTQEARLALERAGVIIFKDASANKGGVTSSSLEVLAALSMTDAEFSEHMQMGKDGSLPSFYQAYVAAVHAVIEKNAQLEFEAIWRENKRTGISRSMLSDEISFAIVKLNEELRHTSLWENSALRRHVLSEAMPKLLLDLVGLDKLMERIPMEYLRAIFGSYLASRFVYTYGIQPTQFAFFEFMSRYYEKIAALAANP